MPWWQGPTFMVQTVTLSHFYKFIRWSWQSGTACRILGWCIYELGFSISYTDWPLTLIPSTWQITSDLLQITESSLQHLPVNIWDMDTFNKAASQLMSMQCRIASTHISGVDMYHAAPLKWPPRSLDHNPCDFWLWLWRMVKADVYVTKLHCINTEGGKKDHCCHPKNSSACVCVCVCVQLP
jgi:hypothetical protein